MLVRKKTHSTTFAISGGILLLSLYRHSFIQFGIFYLSLLFFHAEKTPKTQHRIYNIYTTRVSYVQVYVRIPKGVEI